VTVDEDGDSLLGDGNATIGGGNTLPFQTVASKKGTLPSIYIYDLTFRALEGNGDSLTAIGAGDNVDGGEDEGNNTRTIVIERDGIKANCLFAI
jgi:hypothetical protein